VQLRSQRELGLLLRERRDEMGLSQQAFADLVGVPRLWVSTVENGHGNPTFTRLLAVAERAGLTVRLDDPLSDRLPATVTPSRPQVDLDGLLGGWATPAKKGP
jgi:transcriptional regulator with XRE-family HTH domain